MHSKLSLVWQFIVNLAWNRLVWLVLLIAIGTLAFVNIFSQQALPTDPEERIKRLQTARRYGEAELVYEMLLVSQPLDIDLNYSYLANHFEWGLASPDKKIEGRYADLAAKPDSADLGNYGLGMLRAFRKQYPQALEYYAKIRNPSAKYSNNSIGKAYLELGEYDKAVPYFRKEIDANGNVAGAVSNLGELYIRRHDAGGLKSLVEDEHTRKFVGYTTQRELAFLSADIVDYARLVFVTEFRFVEVNGALMALLVCAMYFVYLWRIDIFEQEPFWLMLIALVAGGIMAQATAIGSDLMQLVSTLRPNMQWQNDIPFFVLHVGLVEELCKFLPVVLIARLFPRQINEPVDFVIYGSLSALGFATVENSYYFSAYGIDIAFGRFLTATMAHMAMTSIVCLAWAYARERQVRRTLPIVLVGLVLASVVHGLYDALLDDKFALVGLLIILVLAIAYSRTVKRLLNESPFYKSEWSAAEHLHNFAMMLSTAIIILAISFVYDKYSFSTAIAYVNLAAFLLADAVPALIIFTALGNISLARKPKLAKSTA